MADFLKVRSLIVHKQVLKNHKFRQGQINGGQQLPSSTNRGDSVILPTLGATYDYDIENLLTLDDGDLIIASILQARGEGDIECEIDGLIIGPPGLRRKSPRAGSTNSTSGSATTILSFPATPASVS